MTYEAVTGDHWEADSSKCGPNLEGIQNTVITRGEESTLFIIIFSYWTKAKRAAAVRTDPQMEKSGRKPRVCMMCCYRFEVNHKVRQIVKSLDSAADFLKKQNAITKISSVSESHSKSHSDQPYASCSIFHCRPMSAVLWPLLSWQFETIQPIVCAGRPSQATLREGKAASWQLKTMFPYSEMSELRAEEERRHRGRERKRSAC